MAGKNYYGILGVSRQATAKEIKQAYRRLARRHHPDVNPGDKGAEARFKEINEAHEVLSDPEKRRKYDQWGDQWQYAPRFEGAGPGGPESVAFDLGDLGGATFFDSLFRDMGGTRGRRRSQRVPREQKVEITLEEAFQGTTRRLEMPGMEGSTRRLEVKIPPGVDTGSRVHISPDGGRHGLGEDLFLVVLVKPHPTFQREGADLKVEVPVSLTTAALGGEVQVPTLKGKIALKVPPETQNGRAFRLAGQGMPRLGQNSRGDLYARVKVVLPTGLTEQEKELFRRLQSLRSG